MVLKTNTLIAQKDAQIARLEHTIILLKEENKRLMLSKFGASSEKFNPNQAELVFDEAENPDAFDDVDDVDDDIISIPSRPRKKTGRTKIPEHITRIEVVYDLADADKFCDHDGHALHKIGEEVSEQLEIIPASVQVKRTIRYKYACDQGIKTATAPKQPIPKSLASPSLLAGIVVNKYQDGLPLYRQQSILKRAGIDLPRATLANWMIRCAELLVPLMNMLRDRLFDAKLIHMDVGKLLLHCPNTVHPCT